MYKALNSCVLLFVDHSFTDPSSEGQSLLVVQPEIEKDLNSSIHKFILSIFFYNTFLSKDPPICIVMWLKRAKLIHRRLNSASLV